MILMPKRNVLVEDRLLFNHVMHGHYVDTRSQLTVVGGRVTSQLIDVEVATEQSI